MCKKSDQYIKKGTKQLEESVSVTGIYDSEY